MFTKIDPFIKEEIELTTISQLKKLGGLTQNQLLDLIAEQKAIGLSVNLKAPTIILPEDCTNEKTPLIEIDLGTLSIDPKKSTGEFDEFSVKLTRAYAILALNASIWKEKKVISFTSYFCFK